MWLALASIDVLALWLTGWFERNESESAFSQRNTNAELSPDWAPSERLVLLMGQKVCLCVC